MCCRIYLIDGKMIAINNVCLDLIIVSGVRPAQRDRVWFHSHEIDSRERASKISDSAWKSHYVDHEGGNEDEEAKRQKQEERRGEKREIEDKDDGELGKYQRIGDDDREED